MKCVVMITVTPNLRHVRSVGVMGQRMVGRPDQPVPTVLKRLRLMLTGLLGRICFEFIVLGRRENGGRLMSARDRQQFRAIERELWASRRAGHLPAFPDEEYS